MTTLAADPTFTRADEEVPAMTAQPIAQPSSTTSAAPTTLRQEVLESLDVLRGKPCTVEVLEGGLTNTNFKVSTPDSCYVVRLFPEDTSALAIDRDREYRNSVTAADSGVGAPVIAYAPEHHVLVVGWLDGTTFTNDTFNKPGVLSRAASAIRKLHGGEAFENEFNMFRTQAYYLSIVQRNGYRLPDGYLDFDAHFARTAAALAADPAALVPCNNDLLAGNFIDCGDEVRLIDYELSGNNDACFELGNIWSECELDDDQLDELVTSYYGRPVPDKIARAKLQGIVSKYGWTLWASIQQATSTIDYDYWAWGMERFDAAASFFSSASFESLLDETNRHR